MKQQERFMAADTLKKILTGKRIRTILAAMDNISFGIIGDGCVDIYWKADMSLSELSLETPHFPLPVVEERFSLGAGSNVAANAVDLGAGEVSMITVIGNDWRGELFLKLTGDKGIHTNDVVKSESRITPAYGKPLRVNGDVVYEDPRLDFENRKELTREEEDRVVSALKQAAARYDVLAVCDQFSYSVVTPKVRDFLAVIQKNGTPVVVDSRKRLEFFSGVIIKPNEGEAARALGKNGAYGTENRKELIRELFKQTGTPLLMTLGAAGVYWYNGNEITHIPGVAVKNSPIDIVGAGDTFLSVFCCSLAAGAQPTEAAALGNIAASVTIKKIGITGTATPEEIVKAYEEL
jgi:rfaE bifunctional protein kinase chain/domain